MSPLVHTRALLGQTIPVWAMFWPPVAKDKKWEPGRLRGIRTSIVFAGTRGREQRRGEVDCRPPIPVCWQGIKDGRSGKAKKRPEWGRRSISGTGKEVHLRGQLAWKPLKRGLPQIPRLIKDHMLLPSWLRRDTPISNWTRPARWSTSRWVERSRRSAGFSHKRRSSGGWVWSRARPGDGDGRCRSGWGGCRLPKSLSILNVWPMCRGGPQSREATSVPKSSAEDIFSSAAKSLRSGRFWQLCCPLVAWCDRKSLS